MDAVRENAEWCDLYVRAHGIEAEFSPGLWWAHSRTPEFYPDAVTLAPDVSPATVLARIDGSSGASVKDSFAALDLSPYGFEILFEAQWISLDAPADPVSDWIALDEIDHPDVVVLTSPDRSARVIAHRSGDVVGLSNLVTGNHGWAEAVAAVASAFPGRTVVGYERGVPPGFTATGPLRVWFKA
jgi:hypothetical protein